MNELTFLLAEQMLNDNVGHVLAVCVSVAEDAVNCVECKLIHHHRPVLCAYRLHATAIQSTSLKLASDDRQSWRTSRAWFSFQRQSADEMYDQQIA